MVKMTIKLYFLVIFGLISQSVCKIQTLSNFDDISDTFTIYDLYFDQVEYYQIVRVHCHGESSRNAAVIDTFTDKFIKQFSDLKKFVKTYFSNCRIPNFDYWNWKVVEAPTQPQIRTINEVVKQRLLVSNLRMGCVLIIYGPYATGGYFKKQKILDLRSIYLLIFVENDPEEYAISQLLRRIWNSYNCLNVIAHTPYSKNKGFIYVYDPFYTRLVQCLE